MKKIALITHSLLTSHLQQLQRMIDVPGGLAFVASFYAKKKNLDTPVFLAALIPNTEENLRKIHALKIKIQKEGRTTLGSTVGNFSDGRCAYFVYESLEFPQRVEHILISTDLLPAFGFSSNVLGYERVALALDVSYGLGAGKLFACDDAGGMMPDFLRDASQQDVEAVRAVFAAAAACGCSVAKFLQDAPGCLGGSAPAPLSDFDIS